MDWFERLTGFRETSYHDTRAKLKVDGSRLQSLIASSVPDYKATQYGAARVRARAAWRYFANSLLLISEAAPRGQEYWHQHAYRSARRRSGLRCGHPAACKSRCSPFGLFA